MEQHHPSLAASRGADQRGAVFQPGPDLRLWPGCGVSQNLSAYGHIGRRRQTAKRAGVFKGRKWLRRTPGEGTAKRPPAPAKGRWQQPVGILFQSRPGEADKRSAALDPRFDCFERSFNEPANIRQNQNGGVALEQFGDRRSDVAALRRHHFSIGRKRTLDIVERGEERLRQLTRFAGDHANAPPMRACIEQMYGAGGSFIRNFNSGDLVSDFQG